MKKIMKIMLIVIIFAITISTFAFAGSNSTSPKGKGTVLGGTGKADDPYQLILGEPIIDIYYQREENLPIFFEFLSGRSQNSCNYVLEHNSDKHRLRFKFQANGDAACRVTSEDGLRYVQAGAACFTELSELQKYPEYIGSLEGVVESYDGTDKATENNNIQIPYYEIRSREEFSLSGYDKPFTHEITLGNGYLMVDDGMVSNISTYGTAYVFAVSKTSPETAYRYLSQEQVDEKASISLSSSNFWASNPTGYFTSPNTIMITEIKPNSKKAYKGYVDKEEHTITSNVRVVYEYRGVNSAINDSEDEKKAGFFEKIVSKLLFSLADGITEHILKVKDPDNAGKVSLTIDSLVFNEYTPTRIEFFGKGGDINTRLQKVINAWYRVFRTWTLIIYIGGLIFIGIRAVLYAGTPNDKKVKMMLEGWVIGLLMIVGFPILMKIAFMVNDALVDILRVNSRYSVYAYYTFTDLYEGEYEDGEDSTTDVVTKLRRKKVSLEKKIAEETTAIEEDTAFLEEYDSEEKIQELQEEFDFYSEELQKDLDEYQAFCDEYNYQIVKRGTEVYTLEALIEEMNTCADEYYQQNHTDSGMATYITEKLGDNFSLVNKETGERGTDAQIDYLRNNRLYNFASGVSSKYMAKAIIDETKAEIEQHEQNIIDAQNKIQDIDNAIAIMENGTADIMSDMKARAGASYRLIYVIAWAILLFELILLLVLYYKRMFILALLIIVFPLVTVAYIYEKMTKPDSSILRNWSQEFLLNVFIQSVHAILYVTLVETGYAVYVGANQNWIIYLIAVTGLITSESLIKNLLGLQGKTVISLTKYAATTATVGVGLGVAIGGIKNTVGDMKKIDTDYKNEIAKANKKYEKADKREGYRRTHAMNKVRGNSRLSEAEKKRRMDKLSGRYKAMDDKKARDRLRAARKRRAKKRIKGLSRLAVNTMAGVGVIAGGIANGGEAASFKNAATTADAIIGSGKKSQLSGDAKANLEAGSANVKTETKVDNVNTTPPPETPITPVDQNDSFDNYGPGNTMTPPPLTGNGGVKSNLYDAFRQRMPKENIKTNQKQQKLFEQKTKIEEEMKEREEHHHETKDN